MINSPAESSEPVKGNNRCRGRMRRTGDAAPLLSVDMDTLRRYSAAMLVPFAPALPPEKNASVRHCNVYWGCEGEIGSSIVTFPLAKLHDTACACVRLLHLHVISR